MVFIILHQMLLKKYIAPLKGHSCPLASLRKRQEGRLSPHTPLSGIPVSATCSSLQHPSLQLTQGNAQLVDSKPCETNEVLESEIPRKYHSSSFPVQADYAGISFGKQILIVVSILCPLVISY